MRGYNISLPDLSLALLLTAFQLLVNPLSASRHDAFLDTLIGMHENTAGHFAPRCVAPQQVQVTSKTQNSLRLTWASDPNAVRFEVSIVKRGGRSNLALINIPSISNSYLFTGLSPNTKYDAYIRRVCPGPDSVVTYLSEWVVVEAETEPLIAAGIPLFWA